MKQVNIYVHSTNKSPHPMEHARGYVLEYFGKGGPVTRSKVEKGAESMNALNSELKAIVDALRRLNMECEVILYASGKVQGAIEAGWIDKWIENGWMTSKGEPVKYVDDWKNLRGLMIQHKVEFRTGHHSYADWLDRECRKEINGNV